MLPARHFAPAHWFFKAWLRVLLRRHFSGIRVKGTWTRFPGSALVVGNHVSWWDGFWVYYLNQKLLGKRPFVMMLQSQLQRHPFLQRIGAFSIAPGRRCALKSLSYATGLLKDDNNLVLMYPQGYLSSLYASPPAFARGIERVARRSGVHKVLFYTALVDYGAHKKPVLTLYLGQYRWDSHQLGELETAFRLFHQQAVQEQAAETQ